MASRTPPSGAPKRRNHVLVYYLQTYCVGGLSGAVSRTVFAPIDRVKILFQVSSDRFTLSRCGREACRIVREEGFLAFWRGNFTSVLRVIPYAGAQFFTYDYCVRLLTGHRGRAKDPLVDFVSGSMAGLCGTLCSHPLDVMRVRLAVQTRSQIYTRLIPSFRMMVKTEGVRSLFAGFVPSAIGIIPYSGLSWMTFSFMKNVFRSRKDADSRLKAHERFVSGWFAALVAQTATYPLDLTRRKLQCDGFYHPLSHTIGPGKRFYKGFFDTLVRCAREGGVRGLWKGWTLALIKGPISLGLSLTLNDTIRIMLKMASAD